MKKHTLPNDKVITESFLNNALEKYTQDVTQTISDIFYRKFQENDKRWGENEIKFNKILILQDKILGKLENWEIENVVGTQQTRELRVEVGNHEKRLKKLESAKN